MNVNDLGLQFKYYFVFSYSCCFAWSWYNDNPLYTFSKSYNPLQLVKKWNYWKIVRKLLKETSQSLNISSVSNDSLHALQKWWRFVATGQSPAWRMGAFWTIAGGIEKLLF